MQDLALKLRAEGRGYDPKVFKKKKESKSPGKGGGGGGGGAAGAGSKHKKAKVKIKSSQRDKAPYHVSLHVQLALMLDEVLFVVLQTIAGDSMCSSQRD